MRRSTSRSLYVAALCASAALALRPDARVDAALEWAFAPGRALTEACAPLRWLRWRTARAAESALVAGEEREHRASERLLEAERAAAIPPESELRAGRRFVHAEFVERPAGRFDALVVRVDGLDCQGLEPGMPVVVGEHFVGRTARLDPPRAGHLLVELVTGREFAVGAELDAADETGAPLRCVVGGVTVGSRLRGDLRLALASPSRRDLPPARAYVDEPASALTPFAAQAVGYFLGRVEAAPSGEYALAPELDFRSGLFRMAIAAPEDTERRDDLAAIDPLLDARWIAARVLSCGERAGEREGFVISAGSLRGVREGAAFVAGARLIGRVRSAGPLSSDVATIADPGWVLHAVALSREGERPIVLGALVALGRAADDEGAIEFEWRSRGLASFGVADQVEVEVFTGAGQVGVPSGLWVGTARLPREAGRHVLRVAQAVDVRHAPRGFVRGAETRP